MSRKNSIREIQDILAKRRDALRQAISGDDSLLKEMSQRGGGDVVDFASENSYGEISCQLAEAENRELRNVELALTKMKDGSYGKCDGCRGNIPLARLQVIPYAAHCVKCKSAAEKAGVDPGTVVDWSTILGSDIPSSDIDLVS